MLYSIRFLGGEDVFFRDGYVGTTPLTLPATFARRCRVCRTLQCVRGGWSQYDDADLNPEIDIVTIVWFIRFHLDGADLNPEIDIVTNTTFTPTTNLLPTHNFHTNNQHLPHTTNNQQHPPHSNMANKLPFTLKGTMLETLLNTNVGVGLEEVEVAADTLGVMQLLRGALVTPEVLDRLLVSPQQVLVATINMLCGIPSLRKCAWSLVQSVKGAEALAAVDWNIMMAEEVHSSGRVAKKWGRYTIGCLDKNGHTKLQHAIMDDGPVEVMMETLKFGPEACNLGHMDNEGATVLIHACHRGLNRPAWKMLEFGPEDCKLSHVDNNGNTALMRACMQRMEGVVMKMLDFGPETCKLGQVNMFGDTALMDACCYHFERAALRILRFGPEACKLSHVNNNGNTALTLACMKGLEGVAVKMLEFGPEACKLNNTALVLACEMKLKSAALKMLEFGPEACKLSETHNRHGDTTLTRACKNGLEEVVMKMLEFGPEACNLGRADKLGNTALMVACMKKMQGAVTKMLEFGAEACKLGHANKHGDTALMVACDEQLEGVATKMLEFGPEACKLGQVNKMEVAAKMLDFVADTGLLEDDSDGDSDGDDAAFIAES